MNEQLRQRLAELRTELPMEALSAKLRAAAHARLVPAKVHPAWTIAVAASAIMYLAWALLYTGQF